MNSPFAVLVNPTANRGKARRLVAAVEDALAVKGAEFRILEASDPGDVAELARSVANSGEIPVAMGGDGTINYVARGVVGTGHPMGIIAAGSGNDFASCLDLPIRDANGAVDVLMSASPRKVDVMRVKTSDGAEAISCLVLSMGFDSEVTAAAERIEMIKGGARYTYAVFSTLARSKPAVFTATFDDEEPVDIPAWIVAVANADRYGGGMKIAPSAELDDGLLDVTIVGPISKAKFVRTFPRVFKGTHVDDPDVSTRTVRRVHMEADRLFVCYADGEKVGPLPADIEIDPLALSVIAP